MDIDKLDIGEDIYNVDSKTMTVRHVNGKLDEFID